MYLVKREPYYKHEEDLVPQRWGCSAWLSGPQRTSLPSPLSWENIARDGVCGGVPPTLSWTLMLKMWWYNVFMP